MRKGKRLASCRAFFLVAYVVRSAELGIPVQFFLLVHPFLKRFGHLVSVVVIVLAVERLTDIDPDLPALQAV